MINTNKEDRIQMAKEVAEVRKSGKTNMYDRLTVVQILYSFGYDFTAEYIENNRDDYMNILILSGDY